ncbi:glycoside hydrolase family protein [Aeromonas caviae]|uniref:glycoside hydrolase family protein n=1 Tax=Aeromonas caviae TaxID=648 RepID=UPI0022593351|nr:glycoside hydrolase family protein [Aeromonas caviae]MCX4071951.1 glycoside hydrolase family protein [Aeromonas caviae]
MEITNDFKSRIKENEGSKSFQIHLGTFRNQRYHLYRCTAGKLTVGFGHNCEAEIQKNPKAYMNGITEQEAEQLLEMDIEKAIKQADYYFQISKHPQAVQEVIIEMIFQLGIATALKFKKFKAHLDAKRYKEAANELLDSNWFKQTPQRVQQHVAVLRIQQ